MPSWGNQNFVAGNFNILNSRMDLVKLTYHVGLISNKTIYADRSCKLVTNIHG